ncbi:MAG: cytochrome P450 [Gammaproteobacteria bacterium]|jgi:cytochrome P450
MNAKDSVPDNIDLVGTQFINNPYPIYSVLRRDRPIVPLIAGGHLLTRHSDIVNVLGSPLFGNAPSRFSTLHSRNKGKYTAADLAANILPFLDPPEHTAPRQIITNVYRERFTSFTQEISALADRYVTTAFEKGATEVISQIAEPFSLATMCRFLGLPETDGPMLKNLTDSFFYLFAPITDPKKFVTVNEKIVEFRNYFAEQLQHRKNKPCADLITNMIRAEHQGHTMTDNQIIDTCILLFADGVENVQYGIGNILIQLGTQPDHLADIVNTSSTTNLIISEAMRLNPPAQLIPRIVLEDTTFADTTLNAGSPVFLSLASANRDETIFDKPDSFVVNRDRTKALTFGSGRHACIGGSLAILQSSALISSLSRSGFTVKTLPHEVKYIPRFGHRWPSAVTIAY